jgi:hypothetical protein
VIRPAAGGGELAFTGLDATALLGLGGVFLGVGALLVAATRRRRAAR